MSELKKDSRTFWLKNLTAVANHQWLFALVACVLSLLNIVMGVARLGKRRDEEKEVIDSDETNLPASMYNLSNEELEDKL